jgi:hypothetical protein
MNDSSVSDARADSKGIGNESRINRGPRRTGLTFILTGLLLVTLLAAVVIGLFIVTGVLQFHRSSISLDAPLFSWRIGGYLAFDHCGPTIHYGFNGPSLPTTGDGLIFDLWCVRTITRQSDQLVLLSW